MTPRTTRSRAERWRWGVVLLACAAAFGAVVVGNAGGPTGLLRVFGIGEEPLGDPADVPPGGTYAFIQHQPGDADEPVAWDPCEEIHYEINPDGSPWDADDTEEFVAGAVEVVAHYTGLRFVYDGRTDRRPEWDRAFVPSLGVKDPVLVSWATEDEVRQLEDDVAGVGGAVAAPAGGGDWERYVTGGITLDADAFDELDTFFGDDSEARAIMLHELGHLVGLGHVRSSDELMFSDNLGRTDFGTGDLNGLVRLGRGRCV
ncbi:matrixin family metalloprotease [Nocardioides humilatus]|uniref:Matrixin family metalloprotease n=1 Tax=Nocardioides humilatus TaxID=2607660 RepID=A0A5B1LE49_9ACTN|nr:matrixin family metalloprotease [Nocardioides humilatus]KAA1418935.1 matrixin family metalloprotease [Nocardioides humilatus]